MFRFVIAWAFAILVAVSSPVSAASAESAKSFVDKVAGQVLNVAKNESLSQSEKQSKIEAIFSDKVDINFIARFALGKHWRTATPEQQKQYLAAYRPFILKNYASRLAKYSGQTYSIKNALVDNGANVVTMAIHDTNGQDVLVDYRLRDDSGSIRIVDVAVEGVSLLTTQRSEFNGIVERKTVDGLIEALRKQVEAKS